MTVVQGEVKATFWRLALVINGAKCVECRKPVPLDDAFVVVDRADFFVFCSSCWKDLMWGRKEAHHG